MNKNTILNKWPYLLGVIIGAIIVVSVVMIIQPTSASTQLAQSSAGYGEACATAQVGEFTVVEKCDQRDRILRRTITNGTGDVVRIDKYNVVKGISYLASIEHYEKKGTANQKVQDETYRIEEGIGSRLHSVLWNEVESGKTDYLYPASDKIWKKKLYIEGTQTLQWIVEYTEDGKFRSIRQYPQGTLSKAIFFDENGDVFTAMDGKGNVIGKPLSTIPTKNNQDSGNGFFNGISNSMQSMNYDVGFMALGDSITYGWTATPTQKAEWDSHFGTLKPLNSGVPIDQTQNVLWRLNNGHIQNISPKVIMVNIGTNNISLGNTSEDTAFGVVAVIGKIKAKLPNSKILLMGVFPRNDFKNEKVVTLNSYISLLDSDANVTYQNISNKLSDSSGNINKTLYTDGLHLNVAGYKVWGGSVAEIVNTLYN